MQILYFSIASEVIRAETIGMGISVPGRGIRVPGKVIRVPCRGMRVPGIGIKFVLEYICAGAGIPFKNYHYVAIALVFLFCHTRDIGSGIITAIGDL